VSVNANGYGGRLTEDDREKIRELAEQGLGPQKISHVVRRHPSTVNWFMYSEGLRAPRPSPDTPSSYLRGGRRVHRFTAAEDALIESLRVDGLAFPEIARRASEQFSTARTPHVIQCRLIMLAAREGAA
jgi:hypothetical protein